jgi:hypothetical protein
MFKELLVLMVVFGFCICNASAAQISCSWIGGEEGLWSDPCNWDCGMVPDNNELYTFVVTIDTSSCPSGVHVGLQQSRIINRLDTYGDVQLVVPDWEDAPSCSTIMFTVLESSNGLTHHGEFEIDQKRHREIEINGDVTNTAGAEIWLSETDINGNFYNESGGIVDIEYECEVNGNFENAGTMNLNGPDVEIEVGDMLHNVGHINLFSACCVAHRIVNDSNGIIQGFGDFGTEYEGELFQNKGVIYACDGSLVIEEQPLLNTGVLGNKPASFLHVRPVYLGTAKDVNNDGTIEVNAGGGVTFDPNLVNEPGGFIKLLGGTLAATTITQTAGATFEGQGSISTANLIIETDGLIRLTGPTNIFGNVQIDPNATLEISDGQTLITGHTKCEGSIHLIGGTVVFQGGCDYNECNIINEAGIDRNHFDVNADGAVNLEDYAYFVASWLWESSWY